MIYLVDFREGPLRDGTVIWAIVDLIIGWGEDLGTYILHTILIISS
jgi:hypothetical protein